MEAVSTPATPRFPVLSSTRKVVVDKAYDDRRAGEGRAHADQHAAVVSSRATARACQPDRIDSLSREPTNGRARNNPPRKPEASETRQANSLSAIRAASSVALIGQ